MVGATLERLATAPAREDEVDGGEHVPALQLLDDVQQVVRGQPRVTPDAVRSLLFLRRPGPRALIDRAITFEQRQEPIAHRKPEFQLDRPNVVKDGLHAASVLRHPFGDLAKVADGR